MWAFVLKTVWIRRRQCMILSNKKSEYRLFKQFRFQWICYQESLSLEFDCKNRLTINVHIHYNNYTHTHDKIAKVFPFLEKYHLPHKRIASKHNYCTNANWLAAFSFAEILCAFLAKAKCCIQWNAMIHMNKPKDAHYLLN